MTSDEATAAPSPPPLVAIRGVAKSYEGVRALRGVDLDIGPGEVHALLGENGAGKSTLIKILAGVVARDSGEIIWRGAPVDLSSRRDALRLGIGVIFQHPEIVDHLSVADNVTLGRERSRLGFVDRHDGVSRTAELLDRLGARLDPRQPARSLRAGERQLVEVARALADDVRLLVMDEPTASLGVGEVEHLFSVVRDLRAAGITILYISHRLEEILAISDRITVLRDGAVAGELATSEASRQSIVQMMIGRNAETEVEPPRRRRPDVVLRVRDVTAPGISGVSFDLHRGEILGVYGLMGSGRTELLESLFGATRLVAGSVQLAGRRLRARTPADAVRAGIGFVPEDRSALGTMPRLAVVDNLMAARASVVNGHWWVRPARERQAARRIVDALGIKTASLATPVSALSGGNQQKVVIGKWLLGDMEILLLDEPTAGVDVGAKAEIYRIISDLTSDGTAIVLATSELPELMALADRVLILRDGRVSGLLETDEIEESRIVGLAFGDDTAGVEWSEVGA